jgi:thioredoxin-related protein
MRTFAFTALLAVFALCFAGRATEGWQEDFQAALDMAEKEKKDILLDFTGSDWCHWCIKLKQEVFDQEAFKKGAPEHFVLVELDFPRKTPVKAANKELASIFGVRGYPTIILTDPQGRAYARTGYQAGGPEKYLAHLAELRKVKAERDDLLARAAKAQGVEKAKLLDEALSQLEAQQVLIGYEEELKQLMEADKDNKAGLKNKYLAQEQMDALLKDFSKTRDVKGTLTKIDKIVADLNPPGPTKQRLLMVKASLLRMTGDQKAMLEALTAAQQADPLSETGERLKKAIDQMKQQVDAQPKKQ